VSDKNDDFLSFEKALRELKMRSEELKKLVSEGEIRAFRDGESMKFRRDDVQALTSKAAGDAELSFADSLEDDTGMVTEQISDEDTLLADDDVVIEAAPARRAAPARASRAAVETGPAKEPGWVTGAAIVGTLAMIWGFLLCYSISQEHNPSEGPFFTSVFAAEKK
jgi:excisionase family DNA binding protein